jgi:CRP-like cAMP-binding protein
MGTIDKHLYVEESVPRVTARGDTIDTLLSASIFAGIAREEIVAILSEFDDVRFDTGHRVTLQGLRGSDFYLIAAGRAAVSVDGEVVATLSRGDFFGEVGVLSDGVRSATVQALTPLHCLVLPHRGLEALLMRHPRLAVNLLQELVARFRTVSTAHHDRGANSS